MQILILSRNKIKDWPGAILKTLPNLTCLKLDNNPLKQVKSNSSMNPFFCFFVYYFILNSSDVLEFESLQHFRIRFVDT